MYVRSGESGVIMATKRTDSLPNAFKCMYVCIRVYVKLELSNIEMSNIYSLVEACEKLYFVPCNGEDGSFELSRHQIRKILLCF